MDDWDQYTVLLDLLLEGTDPETACRRVLENTVPEFNQQVRTHQEKNESDSYTAVMAVASKYFRDPELSSRIETVVNALRRRTETETYTIPLQQRKTAMQTLPLDTSPIIITLALSDVFSTNEQPYTTEVAISDHFILGDEEASGTVVVKVADQIHIQSYQHFDNERVIQKVKEYFKYDDVLREAGQGFKRKRFDALVCDHIPANVALSVVQGEVKVQEAIDQVDAAVKELTDIHMSRGFYADLADQIKTNNDTTQLLGIALRGVLPYAENEVFALADVASKDGDPVTQEEFEKGSEKITRAQQALNILNASALSVENLPDDAFDETFQITFEDEGED